jgi:hypothetical protein
MTSQNGPPSAGPGAQYWPGGTTPRSSRKVIPLQPVTGRPTGERRALMRDAVIQVVHHLVLETVPPDARNAMFAQAADLLELAGWGLDELFEASREGPVRDELMRRLGLLAE